MKVEVVMPQMGESIAEGTIIKWHKQPGDEVVKDEILLEISTDKVDSEIPSSHDGQLAEILVEEGETVDVGTPIAYIETEKSASVNGQKKEDEEKRQVEPVQVDQQSQKQSESPAGPLLTSTGREGEEFYSPLVRSIAEKEGITAEELRSIEGTGISGRVRKQDLLNYIEQREKQPAEPVRQQTEQVKYTGPMDDVDIISMDTMRKSIARHMRTSLDTSAHVYSVTECDMSAVANYRDAKKAEFQQQEGFNLTYTPFIIHAAVKAIKDFPQINSSVDIDKGHILQKNFINIGMAVAIDNGLIVPVIKSADERNFLGIAREGYRLAVKARNRELDPNEVQNGTFTITNPGIFGNLYGLPIINQPQVAILGVGAIKKRPVVINDAIAIRHMMYLSLSYDHRVVDGAMGGQFLERIVNYLEEFNGEGLI